MRMYPVFTFEEPISQELREIMAGIGGRPDSYDTGWQVFTDQERDGIAAVLDARGVTYDVRFELAPAPGEPTADLAAYLPLDEISEIDADPSTLVLAYDDSLTVIASRPLRELIAPYTDGLTWEPYGNDLYILASAPKLPDPVQVLRAVFLSEGANGQWAVQSDGRELLTPRALLTVREAGLAFAPSCTVDGRVLPWQRGPVFSGAVLHALRDKEVNGVIGPPVFLAVASALQAQLS